jgi:hypothetical protein
LHPLSSRVVSARYPLGRLDSIMPTEDSNEALRRELEAKQRNILFPDTLANSSRVDEFLWKGSPNPTAIQRCGLAIFALFYLGAAAFCFLVDPHIPVGVVPGIAFAVLGGKSAYNALRRSKTQRRNSG